MAGGGVVLIGLQLIPLLSGRFSEVSPVVPFPEKELMYGLYHRRNR